MVNKTTKKELNKAFYSATEAANLLGISRTAVHNRIVKGLLKAEKVGRNYVVPAKVLSDYLADGMTEKLKAEISAGVDRVIKEYGETLKLLGKE